MRPNTKVTAVDPIIEDDFLGDDDVFVHANPGESGRILEVLDEDWVLVRFDRTETVTICRTLELKAQVSDISPLWL